jgi:hypothetical protein
MISPARGVLTAIAGMIGRGASSALHRGREWSSIRPDELAHGDRLL